MKNAKQFSQYVLKQKGGTADVANCQPSMHQQYMYKVFCFFYMQYFEVLKVELQEVDLLSSLFAKNNA